MTLHVLLPLFWIQVFAFFMQMMTRKIPWIRIPSIIAYVLLGIWLGNSGWGMFSASNTAWLNNVSQFGLYYLMFLSGMELDIRLLRSAGGTDSGKNPLLTGLLLFGVTLLLAYMSALVMNWVDARIAPWMMMLILSTTSLGIVLPVLREHGLQRTRYGQNLLTAAFLADLLSLLALSLAADLVKNGLSSRQFAVGVLLPMFVICYLFLARFRRTRWWGLWFQNDLQAKMQGLLALLGLFGVITDITGSEPILGSFLAGMLVACFRLSEENTFRQQLELLGYSFIVPLFFVMVGTHFSLASFFQSATSLAWVPCLMICAFGVKVLPMLWFGQERDLRSAWAGGFLLSSRMTLIIVASSIGVSLGLIPEDVDRAILVVAILTCLASPVLFTLINRRKPIQ